ncbi:glucosamine-6-phosphate deaminase [Pelosinus baikalensis]|uniref:Glucosamine-6-phosphate deaminase n=1 Tax=Pelosinus baikalensis TaxID=2892015 RepID=A0ABS8HTC3_9FIRM|nr:glucosamine-6-phosphate deaminase [Pelosinus baikalensis]
MRIVIAKDYEDMSARAARIVAGQIYLKPNTVLGMATGSTPLLMYKELIKVHKEVGLDFSEVITFNLDEYLGLPKEDEQSYYYYMFHHFFNHINIKKQNIYIPDGMAQDVEEECREYDRSIQNMGGIDLQILGIGNNGHIGFNEPDIKFEATTHRVKLDDETIEVNARFFATIEEVPRFAISMGIKTIMHAKKLVLLASGENKAEVLYHALFGGITPEIPASILQLHQDVTVIVEESAAHLVKHKYQNHRI